MNPLIVCVIGFTLASSSHDRSFPSDSQTIGSNWRSSPHNQNTLSHRRNSPQDILQLWFPHNSPPNHRRRSPRNKPAHRRRAPQNVLRWHRRNSPQLSDLRAQVGISHACQQPNHRTVVCQYEKEAILGNIANKLFHLAAEYAKKLFAKPPYWLGDPRVSQYSRQGIIMQAYKKLMNFNTVRTFIELANDFDRGVQDSDKQNGFLKAIKASKMFKVVRKELSSHNIVNSLIDNIDYLKWLWFSVRRRSRFRTSYFEHVFFGEVNSDGHVSGRHSWLRVAQLLTRKIGVNNRIYACRREGPYNFVAVTTDLNHQKKYKTMFMETLPEFDMLIYTLCFWAYGTEPCEINMNDGQLVIQTVGPQSKASPPDTTFIDCGPKEF